LVGFWFDPIQHKLHPITNMKTTAGKRRNWTTLFRMCMVGLWSITPLAPCFLKGFIANSPRLPDEDNLFLWFFEKQTLLICELKISKASRVTFSK
jgi:hypothetical protein